MEQVPLTSLAADLSKLPRSTNVLTPQIERDVPLRFTSNERTLPSSREILPGTNRIQIAAVDAKNPQPAVVVDYDTVDSYQADYVFQTGHTYLVSGASYFGGSLTIEPGAVVKFDRDAFLDLFCPIVFQTTPTRPAILTARDDNSVGEHISTGPLSGTYAYIGIAVEWGGTMDYHDVLVKYAQWGIVPSSDEQDFHNCQFINVQQAIQGVGAQFKAYNVLFENVDTAFYCTYMPCTIDAQHATAHNVNYVVNDSSSNPLSQINCVFDNNPDVYTTGIDGAGSYLALSDTQYRNHGLGGANYDLAIAIQSMTTYSPQDGSHLDTDTPDMGFHYPYYDTDADSLPDWWEWVHFSNLTSQSAYGDSDGDGWTNLQEYQNETDPGAYDSMHGLSTANGLIVFTPLY
jgi:hypothetical protein